MRHIKFDQDWPTGLRYIQVRKCKIFVIQGQVHVTPKWVVWFGPKLNSSELLCLSWLPATLMMIQTKMNKLAWRQHFPIISLWEILIKAVPEQHISPEWCLANKTKMHLKPKKWTQNRYSMRMFYIFYLQPFPIACTLGLVVVEWKQTLQGSYIWKLNTFWWLTDVRYRHFINHEKF